MDVRPPCRLRRPRIHDDEPGRVGPVESVEDAGPQHRLGRRDVVADEKDRIRHVEVGEGAGLAIRAEGFDQRNRCGRGAQPGIAVDMGRADARLRDDRQRVVLLQHQLPGVVERVRAGPELGDRALRAIGDQRHRRIPGRRLQPAISAYERLDQPVRAAVRLPAVEALRAQPAVIDPVDRPSPDTDDLISGDADIEPAASRAEDADRLDPTLGRPRGPLINSDGPLASKGRPRSPDVCNAVARRTRGGGVLLRGAAGNASVWIHQAFSASASTFFSIRSMACCILSWLSFDSWLPLWIRNAVRTISTKTSRNSDCQFWNVHSPKYTT